MVQFTLAVALSFGALLPLTDARLTTARKLKAHGGEEKTCSDTGFSAFPFLGHDSSERLLLREGVIDEIPPNLCGNPKNKNVILVVGDGMGWEMVRAGAIARRVIDELESMGCDTKTGCPDLMMAAEAFQGRTLADYYTEGKGKGLSFQELEGFSLMTTTTTVIQEPNPGNHYAPASSLLKGLVSDHKNGMAPLALNECGFPIDFNPLDFETDGGNMVLWDDIKGGAFPWDERYYQENPDTSDGFDLTYIMQHATDSASTAGCMATGHKAAVEMMSVDLYEEAVSTLVEDAMMCGKAGGVVSSVPMLHATPGAFVTHVNNRGDREALRHSFMIVNPTMASGVCGGGYYPDESSLESMRSGALSSQWTLLTQSPNVTAENFYDGIGELDPDNGDHLLVCLGGDFTASGQANLPYRGVDSTYINRHCEDADVINDPDTGLPIAVTTNTTICNHYEPEEVAQIPHITENVKAALDFLGKDDDGFFLMYEQGDIDWAAHANHMDDMLGAMLDIDDSTRLIMDWIMLNGGWDKNALYVTADHDHYLTLMESFPEALANFLISGESYKITPANNSNENPMDVAVEAGRHEGNESQVEYIRDYTTWTAEDIEAVHHFWGARGSGGNGWGSHSTRPVPLHYMGDDGCIEALHGKGFQVLGRRVEGSPNKVDQIHLHACMLKNLFGLGKKEEDPDLMLDERNVVQLGPRPYYLVGEMKDSPLKEALMTCADETKIFELSDFAIGHRGAPLQFPEHTKISYESASILGAGIIECDVTFTSDLELVCRHAQCDLHTTTDVVMRPEMNAKCTQPWSTGVEPKCCTSDFTLAEIKTLCAKMDSSNDVNATEPEGYVFGGTADWRTDLYQYGCQEVPTHKESIEIIRATNGKFTPELKSPEVEMPFNGFSQEDYAMKMIQEYIDAGVPPEVVWPQSFNLDDVLFWVNNTDYGAQAVALDDDYEKPDDDLAEYLLMLDAAGVKYVAPPMWRLVEPNPNACEYDEYDMQPSLYARLVKSTTNLKIITWTLNRSAPPLSDGGNWYWQTLDDHGLDLTEGSRFDLVHVLYSQVGVEGIFDDWPAVTAFYANCFDIKTRLFR